jgi:predicted enzyme related to lactoylglutathione lyase
MGAGNTNICLLEKEVGSKPSIGAKDVRHYERHWTPVHLDIHVGNLTTALERAIKAGTKKERLFENPEHGSVAFCSDPFGHGFCLLEKRR